MACGCGKAKVQKRPKAPKLPEPPVQSEQPEK